MSAKALLWTGGEIAAAVGTKWASRAGVSVRATGVSTATSFERGDLVFSSGDAAQQRQLLANGAAAVLAEDPDPALLGSYPILPIADVTSALLSLATAARTRFRGRVVGLIGGSADRWVTQALRHVLAQQGPTSTGAGEYDPVRDVALALVRAPPQARFMALEIGTMEPQDMLESARLIRPDIAVVTSPTGADVTSTLAATNATLEALGAEGIAVIPRDSPHFAALLGAAERAGATAVTFGRGEDAAVHLASADGSPETLEVEIAGERCAVAGLPTGDRAVENALAVLATVLALEADWQRAAADLADVPQAGGRAGRFGLRLWNGFVTIVSEPHEADPASMRAAFARIGAEAPGPGGSRIAVLADMLDPKDPGPAAYAELRTPLVDAKVDHVITVGDGMQHLRDNLPGNLLGPHCTTPEAACRALLRRVRADDVVLIKGSARTEIGRVLDLLSDAVGAKLEA